MPLDQRRHFGGMRARQVVISGFVESAAQDGEIFVLRREADGRLIVAGRQSTV